MRRHLELSDDFELTENGIDEILRDDGSKGILDLMLSRAIRPRPDEREHLIIEIKRPSVKIDQKALAQIKSYASALSKDEHFRNTKTRWIFWAVSNETHADIADDIKQKDKPSGLALDANKYQIWVKDWGQVIEECKARLTFFEEHLKIRANNQKGMDFLKQTYKRYLNDLV